ncbi:uncharacterized protein LOC110866726 isoform X1 [Helianthus annuus]|uniref:uncharacterized protein LOC110866726 isoform X1 n=1 Tax=Helianthus annuus TaxID=4232 RepID=UPI000B8FB502|nr:uncharacterized protein LOC110866726 isoform X1 [Helianthus annuus]
MSSPSDCSLILVLNIYRCGVLSSRFNLRASALNEGSSFKKVLFLKPSTTGYLVSLEQNDVGFNMEIAGNDMFATDNSCITGPSENYPKTAVELPVAKISLHSFMEWGLAKSHQI